MLGATGPSAMDPRGWRHICTMIYGTFKELCNALAELTRRTGIYSTYSDSLSLAAFITHRLILLNRNSEVHPIGICETVRHVVSKGILRVIKTDFSAGCEAAIHPMHSIFEFDKTEAALLVNGKMFSVP